MRHWMVVGVLAFWAGGVGAQEGQNVQGGPQREVGTRTEVNEVARDEEEQKDWTFEGGVDVLTAYMFRGYNNVDTGYIVQPYLDVTRHFTLSEELSLDVYGGVWSNIAEDTPKTSGPEHWNEFDAIAGVSFGFAGFSVGVEYLYYNSPANDFDDIHEMGLLVGYEHWLSPSISLYREVDDRNGEQDTYLEFKIEPSLPSWGDFEFSVPAVLGTSLDGYYTGSDGHNAFFGYAAIGLNASYPVTDNWSIVGAVEYHHLFADNIEAINDGEDYKVVGKIGVAFAY